MSRLILKASDLVEVFQH